MNSLSQLRKWDIGRRLFFTGGAGGLSEHAGRPACAARFFHQIFEFAQGLASRSARLIKTLLRFFFILLKLCRIKIVAAFLAAVKQDVLLQISHAILVQLYAAVCVLSLFIQRGKSGAIIILVRLSVAGSCLWAFRLAESILFAVL